jgi:amino acid transporter
VLFGGLGFALAAAGSFAWLAGLSVLTRVLIYIGCIAALPSLRRTSPAGAHTLRVPGGYAIPALAMAACLALLTQVRPSDYLVTALMLGAGTVLYWIARRRG